MLGRADGVIISGEVALTEVAGTGYDVLTAIAVVHHLDLSERGQPCPGWPSPAAQFSSSAVTGP
jgi:hypothetical protein